MSQSQPRRDPAFERFATANPPKPALVGRISEMQQLSTALMRVARGHGSTIFLTGEAGIGKTRLAQEALAIARTRGFRVLQTRAFQVEDGLAYAPFIGAIGPFLRSLDLARQLPLVTGLPDLGRLFGGLRLPTPEPLSDPAVEKMRLFEAVACLIERLARQSPLVVFLDDLHWADPASLELFHYVARGLAELKALLLATCTSPQLNLARGLRPMLQSLQRAGLAEEMPVSRLVAQDIASMARGLLGDELPPTLLDLLNARTGGTPLYVEALVHAFIDAGQLVRKTGRWELEPGAADVLPASVRELVAQTLERLEGTERRAFDLIAVIGGSAPHRLVQVVSGLEHDVLVETLRRLKSLGLVDEEVVGPEVTYRLTHPLVQEVAYADLPEMARRHLHAAIANALERLLPQDATLSSYPTPSIASGQALGQLARHYRGAGSEADQSRALEILLAAGQRAREAYANDEAARYLGAALVLVRNGVRPRSESSYAGLLFPPLLEWLGEAWQGVGELGAAVAVWEEALTEQEHLGDLAAVARLRRSLATVEWDRGHFDAAQAHLDAGLATLAERELSPELISLCLARITFLTRLGQLDRALAEAAEMMALARRLDSPRTEAEAHFAQFSVCLERWEMSAARLHAFGALASAEAAGDPLLIHRAHDRVAAVALARGQHRLARRHAEIGLHLAQSLGAPALEVAQRQWLVLADCFSGAWEQALRGADEALALARRVGITRIAGFFLGQRAMALIMHGDLAGAEAVVGEIRAALGAGPPVDRHAFGSLPLVEMSLAHESGKDEQALAIAAPLAKPGQPIATAGFPPLAVPLLLSMLAEAQVTAGQPENALATARILDGLDAADAGRPEGWTDETAETRYVASLQSAAEVSYLSALAAYAEGLARRALGETDAALACLAEAAEASAALEMPFDLARARLEWARTASATSSVSRQAAVDAATQSLAIFERLGARRYAQRARRLCHRLGAHPPVARRGRRMDEPLSARELEVARLVVDGLTTAEIANRLFISQHTATTHLRRIYSRLGINSRAMLARYVVEAGLIDAQS